MKVFKVWRLRLVVGSLCIVSHGSWAARRANAKSSPPQHRLAVCVQQGFLVLGLGRPTQALLKETRGVHAVKWKVAIMKSKTLDTQATRKRGEANRGHAQNDAENQRPELGNPRVRMWLRKKNRLETHTDAKSRNQRRAYEVRAAPEKEALSGPSAASPWQGKGVLDVAT